MDNSSMDVDDWATNLQQQAGDVRRLWDELQSYARVLEKKSEGYIKAVTGLKSFDTAHFEQLVGLHDWVRRTKGSYDSKLWEMDVLLMHIADWSSNLVAYFGYDTTTHPDISIVNPAQKTAVAIEVKQVESDAPAQVHTNLYDALDQLLLRQQFDATIKYTRWKAYIYVNAGNPWPQTTPNDPYDPNDPNSLSNLMAKRRTEELKSSHWTAWTTTYGNNAKVEVSIWLGGYGLTRLNYTLE
jgi:hypothetical protein